MNFFVDALNNSAIYQVAVGLFDENSQNNDSIAQPSDFPFITQNHSSGMQAVGAEGEPAPFEFWQSVAVGSLLLLLILFTVVGNFFVILAILLERDLRGRPQYYLIFSLAVADLMVGLIVVGLTNNKFNFNFWLSFLYTSEIEE